MISPADIQAYRGYRTQTCQNGIVPRAAAVFLSAADQAANKIDTIRINQIANGFTNIAAPTITPIDQKVSDFLADLMISTEPLQFTGNSAKALALSTVQLQNDLINYAVNGEMASVINAATTQTEFTTFLNIALNIVKNACAVMKNHHYHLKVFQEMVLFAQNAETAVNSGTPQTTYNALLTALQAIVTEAATHATDFEGRVNNITGLQTGRNAVLTDTTGIALDVLGGFDNYSFGAQAVFVIREIYDDLKTVTELLSGLKASAHVTAINTANVLLASSSGATSLANITVNSSYGFGFKVTSAMNPYPNDSTVTVLLSSALDTPTVEGNNAFFKIIGFANATTAADVVNSDFNQLTRCFFAGCDQTTPSSYDVNLNIELVAHPGVLGGTANARDLASSMTTDLSSITTAARTLAHNLPIFGAKAASTIGELYDFREAIPAFAKLYATAAKVTAMVARTQLVINNTTLANQKANLPAIISHPAITGTKALPANTSQIETFLGQPATTRDWNGVYTTLTNINVATTGLGNATETAFIGTNSLPNTFFNNNPAVINTNFDLGIQYILSKFSMAATQPIYNLGSKMSLVNVSDNRIGGDRKLFSFARGLSSDLGLRDLQKQLAASVVTAIINR